MCENDEMKQLADSLWEYFRPKMEHSQKSSISYFKATVVSAASGGKISVKKPFDNTVLSLPYAQSAAQLSAGSQCVVFQMGDMSNCIVVGNGSLSNFGGGGGIIGVTDHTLLSNRDAANQHPISSISGLQSALDGKYSKPGSGIPKSDLAYSVQQSLDDADAIGETIPPSASASNKLVTASEMGDAIASVEAKQLYKTSAQGSFATKAELLSATTFYDAAGNVATPTKNDIAYVLADESHGGASAKYTIASVSGATIVWGFVITFGSTSFSQQQMDAINSGIDSTKRSGYDTHVADGSIHVTATQKSEWSAKYDKPAGGIPNADLATPDKLLDAATFDAVTNWSTQLVNGQIAWRYE